MSGITHADFVYCSGLLARASRTFHLASLLLPGRLRQTATALYAFCREADDAIDSGGGEPALAQLQVRLDRIYGAGPAPDHPVDRAFAVVVRESAIPRAVPEALLEGLAWDTTGRRYETLSELEDYALRVAGTVGLMMALAMGVRDRARLARACDLGVAMQLSNIARDVGEDARNGRLYLPRVWLDGAGLDAEALLAAPQPSAALAAVIARLLARARHLYARADAGIAVLPRGCRYGIRAARLLYAEIGCEVARRRHDSVTTRAVVAGWRKAVGLMAAFAVPRGASRDAPALAAADYLLTGFGAEPLDNGGYFAALERTLALFERLGQRDRGLALAQQRGG